MAIETLVDLDSLRHTGQPTLTYDPEKTWRQNVEDGPVWLGEFPPEQTTTPYEFLGTPLRSPICIPAGPVAGPKWAEFAFKMGYGTVMDKTKRATKREPNGAPNVVLVKEEGQVSTDNLAQVRIGTLDFSDFAKFRAISNSFGNPSDQPNIWGPEFAEMAPLAGTGQELVASVTPTITEEQIKQYSAEADMNQLIVADSTFAAQVAYVFDANKIEYNYACPNVTENDVEGQMYQNAKLVRKTLEASKRLMPNAKFGIKFGRFDSKDQMRRILVATDNKLDFLSTINAVSIPVLDEDGSQILPGRPTSGICGVPLRDMALEQVEWAADIIAKEGLKTEIQGGGGIWDVKDVDRFLDAGAKTVFVATRFFANPLLPYEYELYKQGLYKP